MGPGAMIYVQSFIKFGSAIEKCFGVGGDTDIQTTWRLDKPTFIFFKIRKVG
jgi:hypothetical protein